MFIPVVWTGKRYPENSKEIAVTKKALTTLTILILLTQLQAHAGEVRIPLNPTPQPGQKTVLDLRLESLAEKIKNEGFPRLMAGEKELTEVWVEDIDADGRCSPLDNLVVALTQPLPKDLTLIFDNPNRKPPLIAGREIEKNYIGKTPFYTATVSDQGGWLQSLKSASGQELLISPLHYRLWTGGFCRITGEMDVYISQNIVQARLFLFESPARKTLVCRYNLDDAEYPTNLGPIKAGLKCLTVYKFYPDQLAVENHLFETPNNNFPYVIRAGFNLNGPETVFDSFCTQNRPGEKTVTGKITTPEKSWEGSIGNLPFWLCFKGPQARLGIVFDRPGWQAAHVTDARGPKWGNFVAIDTYFDGLANQVWFALGENPEKQCATLARPMVSRDFFRTPPAAMIQMNEEIQTAQAAVEKIPSGLWTIPARVQLESAKVFSALAEQCWKVYRPVQADRLATRATRYAARAKELAAQTDKEKWPNPGFKNTTGRPAFTAGFYWPWFGCAKRTEQRAEYARKIGITCIHSMDIQAWPKLEENLTPQAVDTAQFEPSLTFLDMLHRHQLKGILLTMDPFWPKWANRLPLLGGPENYTTPPNELIQSARWVEKYVKALKNHPALAAYVIHNEPGRQPFNPKNPQVKLAFVKWLQKRYKNLDVVNQTWRTHYKNWDDLAPPVIEGSRLTPPGQVISPTQTVKAHLTNRAVAYDFVTFEQEGFAAYFSYLTETAVKADPDRPVFSKLIDANLIPSSVAEPWNAAKFQHKVYGTNYYYGPQAGAVGGGIGNMNFMLPIGIDMENEATGLPVWCTEFNQGWWKPYRMGRPGEFRAQIWTSLGKGLRGLFPFAWCPGQWAAFNGDDSPVPFTEAACQFYAQVKALDPILAGFKKPKPQIAFYYARPSYYHRDLSNPSHPERPLSTPLNQLRSLYESVSLVGGFPVGFLPDERIDAGDLKNFKVLIVIEGEYMPTRTLIQIKKFVEGGGTLIAVGTLARFNEYGFAQDFDVMDLIGAKALPAVPSAVSISDKKILQPPKENEIPVVFFNHLHPETRILGSFADKKPAVIEHRLGKGKVLSIGSPAGVATDAFPGTTMEFFTNYLDEMNVKPSARTMSFFETSRNDFAVLGLKDAKDGDWLILVNAGPNPLAPVLRWNSNPAKAGEKCINILNGRIIPLSKDKQEFTIRLAPYEVALIGKLNP
jgi:hypothetical protein